MNRSLKFKGLPDVEVRLIKTILRISSTLRAHWTVKEEGPCDVEFRDSSIHEDDVPPVYGIPGTVVKVAQRGESPQELALQRPLRAQQLIDVLNDLIDADNAAIAKSPASTATARAPADLVRLNAWPSATLLAASPHRTKMAAFLSRQPLRCADLVRFSGRPLSECESFLTELAAAGLLKKMPAPDTNETKPMAPGGSAPVDDTVARDGLLTRLRRKLGI